MSTTEVAWRLRAAARTHPGWFLAVKSALAGTLAWLVVQPAGSFATEYAYYAPLGALAVMTTSVMGSVRTSVESVVAIALGAAVALAAQLLPLPEPLPLGLAILVASLVSSAGVAGAAGSWVPLAAMFVIVAGKGDPIEYSAAYALLTAVGAVVGVGVSALLPQLPLTPAAVAQDRLQALLADQLDELATALETEVVDERDWNALRAALGREARYSEDLVARARDARRANWKAGRWADTVDRHDTRARALQRLAGCVDEVIALLRSAASGAFHSVAALLRGPDDGEEARAAIAELRARVVDAQATTGQHHFAAAAITLNLEQAVAAWT
jgi:uncharacterized membrane protein YgaE (UPF0421/DUF939 family)